MKKIPFALVLAFGLASGSAFAATSGTVTINGEVFDQTCEIVGDADKVVTLAKVGTANFTEIGQTVAPQVFTIGLENCNADAKVYAKFDALAANVDTETGTLRSTGTAVGVNVALLEHDGSRIKLNDQDYVTGTPDEPDTDTPKSVTVVGETATLQYAAAYYSTSATVEAGTVIATANYVIAYK